MWKLMGSVKNFAYVSQNNERSKTKQIIVIIPEAVIQQFWKTFQNLQENTCAGVFV